MIMPKILEKRHSLLRSVNALAPPQVVLGEQRRIVQILANLLSNAAKFTPPGGRIAGLGLYLSKRLAEAMEGWVRAASEVGRGSRFTLGLRLAGSAEFVDSGLSPLEANHHG